MNVQGISLGNEDRSPSLAWIGVTLSPGETLMVTFEAFTPQPDTVDLRP
jgi:hypothetical protein